MSGRPAIGAPTDSKGSRRARAAPDARSSEWDRSGQRSARTTSTSRRTAISPERTSTLSTRTLSRANAGGCPNLKVSKFAVPDDNDGDTPLTVQPAFHLDDSAGSATHFLSTQCQLDCAAASDQYVFWTLDGDARAGNRAPALTFEQLTGDIYTIPPDSQQKDKKQPQISTGFQNVLEAVIQGGQLIASHSTGCKFGKATERAACASSRCRFPRLEAERRLSRGSPPSVSERTSTRGRLRWR